MYQRIQCTSVIVYCQQIIHLTARRKLENKSRLEWIAMDIELRQAIKVQS